MKIVVGIGSIDDYMSYAEAGADEVFFGYVPEWWMVEHGMGQPLNRREVVYYNVQIGSHSELLILRDMMDKARVPVTLTLNSLHYDDSQYSELVEIIDQLRDIFAGDNLFSVIVGDADFLRYLSQNSIQAAPIHLSGEYGELNPGVFRELHGLNLNLKRIIFPRQTAITEMEALIRMSGAECPVDEFEAFLMNEKCQFTGAYCNSVHCDVLCHMCLVPYRLEGETVEGENRMPPERLDVPGASGCGLCALWKLRQAGVSHLKLVSRGNGSEETLEDIRVIRRALYILEDSRTEAEYIRRMKEEIFPDGCSLNCYYREESSILKEGQRNKVAR